MGRRAVYDKVTVGVLRLEVQGQPLRLERCGGCFAHGKARIQVHEVQLRGVPANGVLVCSRHAPMMSVVQGPR